MKSRKTCKTYPQKGSLHTSAQELLTVLRPIRAISLCILFALGCLAFAESLGRVHPAAPAHPAPASPAHAAPLNAEQQVQACIRCHKDEAEGFLQSQMGQSMSLPQDEPDGVVQIPGTTIRMFSNSKGSWQRIESHGQTQTYRVAYVIGADTHAKGFIISLDNHLFQSPVANYRRRAAYDLAPGYENETEPDFTRPVQPGCLFCHAGSFSAIPGTANDYASKPFSHLSIGCSRCHGPLEAHIRHPLPQNIIDPANLPSAARDSICEQCHLKGAARVLNPGKRYSDFVAGQPLEQTFTVYHDVWPGGEQAPFTVISQSEQLARSQCKIMSGNKMWCGTCHDPHYQPTDKVSYFREKCLTCHATTKFSPSHPPKTSNCIGCHMPTRVTSDGGHTVFTDHRIQRIVENKPAAEPLGIIAWRQPPAALQKRNRGIALIEAGSDSKSWPMIVQGYQTLTQVQSQFPHDSEMYEHMGNALYIGRKYSEALFAYALAVRYNPDSSPDEANLGSAYIALGKDQLAQQCLKRALTIDPLNLEAAEDLINLYEKDNDDAKAQALRLKMQSLMSGTQ